MASLNPARRILSLKLVYYGPGLSGKTTNLEALHKRYPGPRKGRLVKLDTEQERTLFFDYFPVSLGQMGGYRIKIDLFTVPGQSFYNTTRRMVLEGADGVAFIADSGKRREEANGVALNNLRANLQELGRTLSELPLVFQWNKRDLPDALPLARMQRMLNPAGLPEFEAVASEDQGVWETQSALLKLVLKNMRQQSGRSLRPRRRGARAGAASPLDEPLL